MKLADIQVQVLGPVTVIRDGEPLRLPARQLALVALAALSEKSEVTFARLGEAFGANGRPPREATLRGYISELRTALGGYPALPPARLGVIRLGIARDNIDYRKLRDLLVLAKGRPAAERLPLLRQAHDLWQPGRLWDGLGNAQVDDEIRQLQDQRRTMFLELIAVNLELGETAQAVADAEAAAELWPKDEMVARCLWKALASAGRGPDIQRDLDQRGRVSREARAAAKELMAAAHRHGPVSLPASLETPRQLPPATTVLHGRDEELAQLDALTAGRAGPRVAAVIGLPGVGKTLLSHTWASRAEQRFPDGTLHVDLHGYSDLAPKSADEVLGLFVRALGGNPDGAPFDQLLAMYRTRLAGLAVLVVLDNAVDFMQIKALLATGPESRTLVTSRSSLITSETVGGFYEIVLQPVTSETGLAILREAVGADRVHRESRAARDLVERCGGLPLALKLVAAQARRRTRYDLEALLKELELMDLSDQRHELRRTIGWSVAALPPDAVRMLHVMGVHPGPSIDADVAAYLAGISRRQAMRAIDDLLDSNLVHSVEDNRFSMHDVIREYAVSEAVGENAAVNADVVRETLLKYLLWAGAAGDRGLNSGREVPMEAPEPEAPIPKFAGKEEAMAWFAREHEVFLAVLQNSAFAKWPAYRWMLPMLLCAFQTRAGHWTAAEQLLTQARDVSKQNLPDLDRHWVDAVVLRLLGLIQRKRGRYEPAIANLRSSVERCGKYGFQLDQAHAHQQLSVVHEDREQWPEALYHSMSAYTIYKDFDDHRGIAHTLNVWISAKLHSGSPEEALDYGSKALAAAERADDGYGLGSVHRNLLRCQQTLGQHTKAIKHAQAAIQLYQGDSPVNEAYVQIQLAESYRFQGLHDLRRTALERAKILLTNLADRRDHRTTLTTLTDELAGLRQAGC
ncbi:ATP-binding protein [Micromonospora echinospora]|uniref:ATP-binding protein n=1 Tax=Micromonospora echinospora TaxID=1877 RepID=UPI003671F35A